MYYYNEVNIISVIKDYKIECIKNNQPLGRFDNYFQQG